jgi:hypothetical protein
MGMLFLKPLLDCGIPGNRWGWPCRKTICRAVDGRELSPCGSCVHAAFAAAVMTATLENLLIWTSVREKMLKTFRLE